MKYFVLILLLAGPAAAQQLPTSAPPKPYHVGNERAPLYRTPADTARPAGFFLAPHEQVNVVGQFSPRWVVVKRTGFAYLVALAKLVDLLAGTTAPPPHLADGTLLPIDAENQQVTYQGVVEVPGASKDQLFDRALEWMAKTYQSANDVVQIKDKEQGKLLAKGGILFFTESKVPAGFVMHTQTIYVRDGRYKYVMTGFKHQNLTATPYGPRDSSMGPLEQGVPPTGFREKLWYEMLQGTHDKVKAMVTALDKAMQAKGSDPSKF